MTANGYRDVTTYICVKGASDAIEFYTKAFGAHERYRIPNDDGTLGHAEIEIGETTLMLSDEWAEAGVLSPMTLKGNSVSLVLSVDDADAAFERAIEAGAKVQRPIRDEPYGRGGWLVDPFGHRWNVLAPKADSTPEAMG